MLVMKFGGSSLADAERILKVSEIVKSQLTRKPVLVLSAMGDTTDHLLEASGEALSGGSVSVKKIKELHLKTIQELGLKASVQDEIAPLLKELESLLEGISLIRELTGRTKDYLVSFGERLSVRIAAAFFRTRRMKAQAVDAWDAGFVSDSNFTQAELLRESWELIPQALLPLIDRGVLPVITGFIARDRSGSITTLGRGGSDLSATIIAASCGAEEAQVWKDVDGILSADPRIVKKARPVEAVSYDEAAELAYFGAQVLHPRAMQPCQKTGTPVLVKNTFNPSAPGTRIVAALDKKTSPVRAITSKKNVTLVDVVSTRMLGQYGFLEEVFSAFARHHISVDMVATSEVSISLTLDAAHDLGGLKKDLGRIAAVEIKTGKAIVTIIGDVRRSSEILFRTFRICALLGVTVQMVSQGASKVNISFIVNDTEAADVVKAIHADFFDPSSAEETAKRSVL
ncbi:MAG: aspartate kinase [Spirochaetaceae bacterium]|jgi:aspartate kinase|nr:aspartate kinase [Spirochaetaceae bacterium]